MAKLKDTQANRLKVVGATIGGFSLIGLVISLTSKKENKIPILPALGVGGFVGLCASNGMLSWVIQDKQSGFDGVINTLEGLPSTADQADYITNVVKNGWTDGNEKQAQTAMIVALPNMSDSDIRDIYKYYKDYYDSRYVLTYEDGIPADDSNNIQRIFNNNDINHN